MKFGLAIACALVLSVAPVQAETVSPADVVYTEEGAVEASLTGVEGDPANGRKIIITRGKGNCIACHEVEALKDAPFHGEVGPPLDGVGEYRSAAELRGIVSNAKIMFEDSVMPSFYKTSGYIRPGNGFTGKPAKEEDLSPLLTAQEIEDVVAFLLTLKE